MAKSPKATGRREHKPVNVRLAFVQMACTDDYDANIASAERHINEAVKQGAEIVCLQELFAGLYPCQSEDHDRFDLAEPIPGPTSHWMSKIASEKKIVLTGSIFERRAPGLYHNTAVVMDRDGSQCGLYRKMHIPDDPHYYEKFYFTPGDTGFTVAQTSLATIGVGVCWDQWYPEAARLFALRGAQILLYPTAIGWLADDKPLYGRSQKEAWETMMRSHAIANGLYVGAANRVGLESSIEFWGGSFVYDPYGNLLSRACDDRSELVIVDCDLGLIDKARTYWPFLRDRRVDAFQPLTQRWIDDVQ